MERNTPPTSHQPIKKANTMNDNITELNDQGLADAVGGAPELRIDPETRAFTFVDPETGAELSKEELGRTPLVMPKPGAPAWSWGTKTKFS
jgi:hypothetical protein